MQIEKAAICLSFKSVKEVKMKGYEKILCKYKGLYQNKTLFYYYAY